jgi:asparagine synthase (glutamine-hydrolysing)
MQGRLSEQLLHRPKRAEPRPMAYWLRGQGSPFLRERIDALCDQSADIFVPDVVRTIMEEHLSGQTDHSVQLWTLVMFGAWRSSLG